MLIGIDGNEANVDERVGVHQYAFNLLWGLKKLNEINNLNHSFIIFLKNRPKNDLPEASKYWNYKIINGNKLWILKNLMPHLIRSNDLDVFFTPSHYLPLLPISLKKVCTIHDLGYLRFSEQFQKYDYWQLKLWTAMSIYISKYIIAVSQYTRKDIVRHYPFASEKIFVTYHGYDKHKFQSNISRDVVRRVVKKYNIPSSNNYILFLSTLKPSKNIEGLIDAFSIVKKHYKKLSLVIAGKKGWMFDTIFKKVKTMDLEKDIIFTDFVSEKDKPALMKGAKLFISPSFWEGFGIHVLEAMATGTPVVVSNVASLPEVAGSAGIYVDPNNINDIVKKINKVLKMDSDEYNKEVKKVTIQANKFSWERTAKDVLEVLEG